MPFYVGRSCLHARLCHLKHQQCTGGGLDVCLLRVSDKVCCSSQGEKLLGSLGGIFSKTWKAKKTKKITGPMVGRGRTSTLSKCVVLCDNRRILLGTQRRVNKLCLQDALLCVLFLCISL